MRADEIEKGNCEQMVRWMVKHETACNARRERQECLNEELMVDMGKLRSRLQKVEEKWLLIMGAAAGGAAIGSGGLLKLINLIGG